MSQQPFVVLGGGIIGLSIALSLQERQVPVLLIDKDTVGAGASSGNAGHIATEQVFPIADPSMLKKLPSMLFDPLGPLRVDWRYLLPLLPWGLRLLSHMRKKPFAHIHQQLTQLNAAALPAWQRFTDKWQLADLVKIQGSLQVAEKATTVAKLQQHGDYLNQIGVANSWLSAAELAQREPHLAENQLGALFYPDTGHVVNLPQLLSRLQQAFVQAGGQVLENTKVTELSRLEQGHIRLVHEQGELTAAGIAVCCGAYSKPLVQMLTGIRVPLETERGYHLMLPQEQHKLSIPVSSADRMFIMTPMQDGLRLAGTVEYGGLNLPANMQRARNFLPLANGMLKTALNAENSTEWMGFRPTIADSLPVIDKIENCYFAFGHQHLGLTHAAITAELVTELYCSQQQDKTACKQMNIKAFSLQRF